MEDAIYSDVITLPDGRVAVAHERYDANGQLVGKEYIPQPVLQNPETATPISKSTLLPDSVAAALGLPATGTVADGFEQGLGLVKNSSGKLVEHRPFFSVVDVKEARNLLYNKSGLSPDAKKFVYEYGGYINLVDTRDPSATVKAKASYTITIAAMLVYNDFVLLLSQSGALQIYAMTESAIELKSSKTGLGWVKLADSTPFYVAKDDPSCMLFAVNETPWEYSYSRMFKVNKSTLEVTLVTTYSTITGYNRQFTCQQSCIQYGDSILVYDFTFDSNGNSRNSKIRRVYQDGTAQLLSDGTEYTGFTVDQIRGEIYGQIGNTSAPMLHRLDLDTGRVLSTFSIPNYSTVFCFGGKLYQSNFDLPLNAINPVTGEIVPHKLYACNGIGFVDGSTYSATTLYRLPALSVGCITLGFVSQQVNIQNLFVGNTLEIGGVLA